MPSSGGLNFLKNFLFFLFFFKFEIYLYARRYFEDLIISRGFSFLLFVRIFRWPYLWKGGEGERRKRQKYKNDASHGRILGAVRFARAAAKHFDNFPSR